MVVPEPVGMCAPEMSAKNRAQSFPRSRRRGVALLLVLIAAVVAFTVASAHLTSQSTTITIAQNVQDQAQARCVAESGMRIALAYVQSTPTWRDDQSHGTWVSDAVLGSGTFTVVGEDGADSDGDTVISQPAEGDGDLSDSDSDMLTLSVTGRVNGAVHVLRAQVAPVLGGGAAVLLVVDDAHNLTAGEEATRDLIESWDYAIELISASDSQGEFDSAVANVQVAYVAEDMLSSDLGTKLRDVSIGVVNEETALASEFAFSNDGSTYTGTAIDIVDNSHDITSPFPLGALTILTSSTELNLLGSSLASGADVLAERVSSSSVAMIAIELGATLNSGAAAPGRRVDMPWGGNSFDISQLNDDGQTLMRRALDWAAMPGGGGLYDFATGIQGTNAFAYDGQSTTKIPTTATAPSTVFSSGEYDAIEVDDSSSHSYAAGSGGNYPQMRFVLQTLAKAATVGQLDISLIGRNVNVHPSRVNGVELHIWNYSTSAYEQLAVSASTNSEVTLSVIVATNAGDYLGGSGSNTITLLVVARDAKGSAAHANTLYMDYVGVTVTTQRSGGSATTGYTARWIR